MQNKYAVLQSYFGYTQFREGQEILIDALLSGRDALGIMPTGAGKSLCYQVPALVLPGVALVISPLISLMQDQVNALLQTGAAAAFVNSSLSAEQIEQTLQEAAAGQYKILYVAPERLSTRDFTAFARTADISLISVDEAHCVSQWGQDFRPSYLKISEFIQELPQRPPLGAFTATATERVKKDIMSLLGLQQPALLTTGFDRQNLYFEVRQSVKKDAELESFLSTRGQRSGIIYCLTRKTVEEVCARLNRAGYRAVRYHAGLSEAERQKNQEIFQLDQARIMVATNAFGMGIDKSNVTYVLHYNMPKNLEAYYQEAGRAGRDGSEAECVLLFDEKDVSVNKFFIEKSAANEAMDEASREFFQEQERERLKQMTAYCQTPDCLRQFILGYFGEQSGGYCGKCFNCLHQFASVDMTVPAQKILSCVKRMGERYGVKLVIHTLRGQKNEQVAYLGLNRLSTYGVMADTPARSIRRVIDHLLRQGYLESRGGSDPAVRLGPKAPALLFGGEKLLMKMLKEEKSPETVKRSAAPALNNPALFARLQALRTSLAQAQAVPAYVIFPDATLREMCEKSPRTAAELLRISGVGQTKLARYGPAFLQVLREEGE
jgi:ATP-dependent DNA helicase RecQ